MREFVDTAFPPFPQLPQTHNACSDGLRAVSPAKFMMSAAQCLIMSVAKPEQPCFVGSGMLGPLLLRVYSPMITLSLCSVPYHAHSTFTARTVAHCVEAKAIVHNTNDLSHYW